MTDSEMAAAQFETRLIHNKIGDDPKFRVAPAPDVLDEPGAIRAWDEITSWPNYRSTPLHRLPGLAHWLGIAELCYKDEGERFDLGSFKALGGAYGVYRQLVRLIEENEPDGAVTSEVLIAGHFVDAVKTVTVCCATDGNHGRSVAWGAQLFGCDCVIFVPSAVSAGRKKAIESYGATVFQLDGNYDEAVRHAQNEAKRNGWYVISDTSYEGYVETPRDVMQGYTVMAREAFSEFGPGQPPTHIFVQGGVGGLAAAVCTQSWRMFGVDRPRIVVVEPENADCIRQSLASGQRIVVDGDLETVMAGLSAGEVSLLAWKVLKHCANDAMTVPDELARQAMRILAQGTDNGVSIVAGESAVAGLAALLLVEDDALTRRALGLTPHSIVLLFGTEGATDPSIYEEIVGLTPEVVRQA